MGFEKLFLKFVVGCMEVMTIGFCLFVGIKFGMFILEK